MHNPVVSISLTLPITAVSQQLFCLPLSNSTVQINGIPTDKMFNLFHHIFSIKEVKVLSIAIDEIMEQMQQILDEYTVEQAHKKYNSENNQRQKGRDNHTNSQKEMLVSLPVAQSINHASTICGEENRKGGEVTKLILST
jgi:hypothetical protein